MKLRITLEGQSYEVDVEVLEPMGAECVLYVTCGGEDMVVNLDSSTTAKERQPLDDWYPRDAAGQPLHAQVFAKVAHW